MAYSSSQAVYPPAASPQMTSPSAPSYGVSPTEPPPPYSSTPIYSTQGTQQPNVHEAGRAGGKPIYVQGSAPTPVGFVAPCAPPPMGGMYQTHHVVTPASPSPYVIRVEEPIRPGMCPACREGYLHKSFTCLGVFVAIVLFPIGILCCLLMTDRKCSRCGLTYS